jgi:transcription elongation factor Elf1
VTPWRPKCPHCGSRLLDPCAEVLERGTENEVHATHECRVCAWRFRIDPPQQNERT